MFTGLVQECGRLIAAPEPSDGGGVLLRIGHSRALAERLDLGASLSVSGVCLTVVETAIDKAVETAQDGDDAVSVVELSPETLRRTTLGELEQGSAVNLEPALAAGEPLGGHWVQGHVDATLEVLDRRDLEDHRELVFELPSDYAPYVVEKGSVTLDGVSLTVSRLVDEPPDRRRFEVALIPHTLEITHLDTLEPGMRVNFEVDILAKYVHRALALGIRPERTGSDGWAPQQGGGAT